MNNTLRARTNTIELLESRRLFSTVTVGPAVVAAGTAPTQAVFIANLDAPSAVPIRLSFSTVDGSAKAGLDYRATTSHVIIPAGATTAPFSVKVLPSTVTEPNRTFFVNVNAGPQNSVAAKKVSATIIESATLPSITVSDATIKIFIHHVQTASFFVGLTQRSASPVTINYSTQDVTAFAGANYFPGSGTLVIPPFKNGGNIKIKIVGDAIVKPDKVFNVNIISATNGLVPSGLFSRVVIEDDAKAGLARPSLTVSTPRVVRGSNAQFVLTLSAPSVNDVTVRFFTADITANTTQYTPAAGILTIPAGATTATITVPTRLHTSVNVDTQFRLVLSAPANAQLVNKDAVATILAFPTISISDPTIDETNATPVLPARFDLTLDAPSRLPVTVTFNTANGDGTQATVDAGESAAAGIDYTASSGTVTFQPGQTTLSFTVPILADALASSTEIFTTNLSGAVNGIIGKQTGTATILNLFDTLGTPIVTVGDASGTVHNAQQAQINFVISLDRVSSVPVTVQFATTDGTAVAGIDYTFENSSVTFNPGETNKLVSVPIFGASATTTFVQFTMLLASPVNATLALVPIPGTGTITELAVGL